MTECSLESKDLSQIPTRFIPVLNLSNQIKIPKYHPVYLRSHLDILESIEKEPLALFGTEPIDTGKDPFAIIMFRAKNNGWSKATTA